jgi:integrase
MGLRISDLSKSSKANFVKDEDGDYMYESTTKKTSNKVTIPLIELPLTILKKYDFNLPRYTGQYFNRELKKILKHYKLFEYEVIKRREVQHVEIEEKKLKREIISSHICRKTFITLCVESLLPVNVIMKASGHKQLATILSYIQKSADKNQFKKLDKIVKDNLKEFRKNTSKAKFEEENLKSQPYQRL